MSPAPLFAQREGMGEQLEELRGMILGAWDGQAGGKRGRGQGGKGVGCVGGRPQAMLFSATMPDDVAAVCKRVRGAIKA